VASEAVLGEWRAPLGSRIATALTAVVFAVCLATLLVAGLVLAARGSVGWLACLPLAGPVYTLARAAVNAWNARLTITTREVDVRGITRTHRLPLREVDGFEARVERTGLGGRGTPMVVLHRRDAPPIGVFALSRPFGFVWSFPGLVRQLAPTTARLNAILEQAHEAPMPILD
jgi:hypothetical protein